MRTRRSLLGLVLAALLVLAFPAFGQGFYISPHVQNITKEGATIIWETPELSDATLAYGRSSADDTTSIESENQKIHRVRLSDLLPETEYRYKVTVGAEEFEAIFKTAPVAERPITFVVFGDSRRWEDRFEETEMAAHALQWNPEFFLNMGDLVNSGHEYDQWPRHFERFSAIVPQYMMLTARGNHEGSMLHDTENDWFAKYHDFPGEGEPFAAFDWGNTHIVLISYEQTREAAEWLDKHLADVDKKYVIVAQHYPVYCSGYFSPTDSRKELGRVLSDLAGVLEKHNVTVDLAGHTHIYERLYPLRDGKRDDRDGVQYIVQGGDINANYPEEWTAVKDDRATMAKPTYTVFHCGDDRMDIRTFCWSTTEDRIAEIDHLILWQDESVPKRVLDSLDDLAGDRLIQALEELGAMFYQPAAPKIVPYLNHADQAVRRAAARALRGIGSADVAPDLVPFLNDPDLTVRRQIARALEIAMPKRVAREVAAAARDPEQDPDARISLIGALQFHAPEKLAYKTVSAILQSEAPAHVRARASYALMYVADESDAKAIAKVLDRETNEYVLTRLAFTLNELTGRRQNLSSDGPLMKSAPGERDEFIKKWLKG